jgi:PBP1b-binding outer membrane lipoprotein LpoB
MKKSPLLILPMLTVLYGCGETRVVDLDNQKDVADMQQVMELEYRDWASAAEKMTKSMTDSGSFANIKKPVIAIADIENDTMQRFDTDILIKKIRTTLVNSGKARIATGFQNKTTTATGYIPVSAEMKAVNQGPKHSSSIEAKAKGYAEVEYEKNVAEDETTHKMRELRGNKEYDAKTIAAKGTLVAPNLSLSGKMLQRNIKLQSGLFSSTDTRVEYYLQLTLTDLKTGLSIWEDEQPIVKEGDHAPTW